MRLHNGTTDGQPHPAALRFGREESRKDLVSVSIWQSRTCIADREQPLTILPLRLHRKLSALVPHGFDGIEHEVHEDLLQLHAVCLHYGQFGSKFGSRGNGVSDSLTLQQG